MKTTLKYIVGLISLMGLLTACTETAPRYEAEFGNATRATLNSQIINQEASKNQDPVAGIDGRSARDAVNNYQKSFSKPQPQPNVFNFGVGGDSNGGSSN